MYQPHLAGRRKVLEKAPPGVLTILHLCRRLGGDSGLIAAPSQDGHTSVAGVPRPVSAVQRVAREGNEPGRSGGSQPSLRKYEAVVVETSEFFVLEDRNLR